MKIIVVYIYALGGANGYLDRASKFLNSYHSHDPQCGHDTLVIANGGRADEETKYLFSSLPNLTLVEHDDNLGMDIGAYQFAASRYPCDLMVFLGGNTYIKCVGWLRRMQESFLAHGDTLYGCMGNSGVPHVGVYPHIRTTGWWMSPALFNKYPIRITRNDQRYGFEHGEGCLTSWIIKQKKTPWVVAYDGEYAKPSWDQIPNGYHNGDQSNLLVGDRMTQPPYYHTE